MYGYNNNCIFVYEAGFNSCTVPRRARSRKGKKAHVLTKIKRAKNISIIGAISHTRLESLQAVVVIDKRTDDRFIFGEFVAQLLKWLDEQYGLPMIVIMDNAKFHKSENVAEIFENSQHKAHFLPPFSPMFNPIESCFSELKNQVKRIPRKGKDVMLNLIIKGAGDTITTQDCNGWSRHCIENINKCMRGENLTFDN
ncbi:hypothetical protein [Parasitella parasitica]|uniref:Tc1-like transposase DDE domain-containing protein n=1 Tax=Parasitella parasitica TaxID=35722 RepID=A0A0B7NMP1_9FUNG|nr:hypothetical protein [Parasitella parasitica]